MKQKISWRESSRIVLALAKRRVHSAQIAEYLNAHGYVGLRGNRADASYVSGVKARLGQQGKVLSRVYAKTTPEAMADLLKTDPSQITKGVRMNGSTATPTPTVVGKDRSVSTEKDALISLVLHARTLTDSQKVAMIKTL